ncbi:MAG: hypothetical protein KZQ85_13460 [Candidatus Thiodiazotropha sp. (ex Myrtea sp. 'scaly one' KF741663)]|nr:hypothetical protein [Candidatus Thiodiazotropha sp. (ex Myrtea sp. 'scaly one' KF741663)]
MKHQLVISIVLILFSHLIEVDELQAGETTPGIYIERVVDRSRALVPGLKAQYKICADQRLLYKKLFEQGGVGWEAVKQSLPKGYNVRAVTAGEPDWEKEDVGRQIEKEYFYGEKYALYQHTRRYEISEVARCALIEREDQKINLDNGTERYLITLKDKRKLQAVPGVGQIPLAQEFESHKVSRMPSAKRIRNKNDEVLDEISKDEKIARLLSLLYADTTSKRPPGVGVSFDPKVADNLREAMGYEESNVSPVVVPRANDEHFVAGQPCDIISAKNMRSRLWYWDKMHYYPATVERPILLKTELTKKNKEVVGSKEATKFSVLKDIDNSVFELDPSLR